MKAQEQQMAMKNMSDDVLHSEALEAAKREKRATYELLEFLHEVDRRRLHSVRGYSSLFVYVRDYLGYSDRQAFERVAAMRLVFKIEEVKIALQNGKLNLTTTAQLAVHVRKNDLTATQTRELLPQIETRSKREIEKILEPTKLRTITMEIDNDCEALLERFKELEGNPGLSIADCLKITLRRAIRSKERKNTVLRPDPDIEPGRGTPQTSTVPPLVPAQAPVQQSTQRGSRGGLASRYILKFAREAIMARAQNRCEYVDPKTGKRCDGKYGLQFDHVTPFALGGASTEINLQLLCPAHNRLRAIQTYGDGFMRQWIE